MLHLLTAKSLLGKELDFKFFISFKRKVINEIIGLGL